MTVFRVSLTTLFLLHGILSGVVFGSESVSFSWAFFLKSESRQVETLGFDVPETVSEGELLRIYLELHEHSFVYLYLFDSMEDLYMVFPPSGSFYNGDFPVGYKSYIPSGREWFALDDFKGTERFYLLASSKRLIELEELTDNFLATGDQGLKLQLRADLESIAKKFSITSAPEIDLVQVSYGSRSNVTKSLSVVTAHKIWAPGVYGKVLDLVNR